MTTTYWDIRKENKRKVSKASKEVFPFDVLKQAALEQVQRKFRRLDDKKDALKHLVESYPGLKEAAKNMRDHFIQDGMDAYLFMELLREDIADRYHGIFVEAELVDLILKAFANEPHKVREPNKQEDYDGTDLFINGFPIQIKTSSLTQKQADDIILSRKILVEVDYRHCFTGNRTLTIDRQVQFRLSGRAWNQMNQLKQIFEERVNARNGILF